MDDSTKESESIDIAVPLENLKTYLTTIVPTILGISNQSFSTALNNLERTDILSKFVLSSESSPLIIGALVNGGKFFRLEYLCHITYWLNFIRCLHWK